MPLRLGRNVAAPVGNLNEKKLAVAARAERVFKILRGHQTAHPEYFLSGALALAATGKYVETPRELGGQQYRLVREALWFIARADMSHHLSEETSTLAAI
jgi:hypothetical protein